ncbi:replicative DNA helicase [Streptomyces sp. NPDC006798]|uniref:replicative DNA helicase n=1 Tax=Streptomyces sp. NPDC006798 TaxID=3155462 RepID=UPI0033DFABF3
MAGGLTWTVVRRAGSRVGPLVLSVPCRRKKGHGEVRCADGRKVARVSISEPLDDPWAADGIPGDRLPVSRSRRDDRGGDRGGDRRGGRGGRDDQHDRGQDGGWDGGGGGFERVPPQDLDAEQSVLGGMLLSKDAIADVVEIIKGHDFYRPAHETVYTAILDLYAKGEPADPITVAAELVKRGEITRVGGASYLHTLVQSVPTAANASYYAEIVHERAVLRRLVEAGTKITQMGYAADGDVDEIVNSAQAEIYAVTEQRTSEDYLPLGDIMEGALDEIEAIGSRSGEMTGVPTGFTDFDSLTNGLHPGQMIVIAARPAMGKALALDTPLPTPDGWTTMGAVRVGDLLLAHDGTPNRVVAATEVMTGRPCFEITFDDGTTVVADAGHQWVTETGGPGDDAPAAGAPEGAGAVRTTREIAATLLAPGGDGRAHHSVLTTAPLALPHRDLPEAPRALGARLGARPGPGRAGTTTGTRTGTATVASAAPAGGVLLLAPPEPESESEPESEPYTGPAGRRVPPEYLRASAAQRRELLAGLLETGGTAVPVDPAHCSFRFTTASRALADDVRELVVGLGHRCDPADERSAADPEAAPAPASSPASYDVVFTAEHDASTATGADRGPRRPDPGTPRRSRRFITAVRPVPSVPVRCVQVENPAHLYLATRSMVPTHNSTLALDFARAASIKNNLPSVIFSLEMGRNEIAMRLLSAEARVALHHMRSGTMTDDDWTRLARRMPDVSQAPLYIDDSPNLSMMEIRAKCRRLKQRNDLKLVVIDYLQLMQSGGSKRAESRQQEVSDMSRNLKLLAKELEVPVIALSQLNRGPEQRTDKKPMVSDLRESGSIEQDADMVILLHREDAYEKESPRAGEADLIVAKHRNGPTATITVAFQGHYSRFVDMAQT